MSRRPPDGFEFLRAKLSQDGRWWRYLCPVCCAATVALVPHGNGWRTASEIGCSRGCKAPEIEWWQAWRCGELPPKPEPDGRARQYARGAIRNILAKLPERPTQVGLRRAAYDAGRFLQAGDLDEAPVAAALAAAADRAGLADIDILAAAMTAGRATHARLPR